MSCQFKASLYIYIFIILLLFFFSLYFNFKIDRIDINSINILIINKLGFLKTTEKRHILYSKMSIIDRIE